MNGMMREFADAAAVLLEKMPEIYTAMGQGPSELDSLPGWQAMRDRYHALQSRGDDPALIVVLYGPSGAGKSTFFRLLTGTEVPAGGHRRPLTNNCCAAIPRTPTRDEDDRVRRLFPDFDVRRLDSPEQLTAEIEGDTILYYVSYEPPDGHTDRLPLVVTDIPDISTIKESNWQKAREILARAEIVTFLVYPETYKDKNTVEHLKQCCQESAYLAFVFTKLWDEDTDELVKVAREMWQDLLEYVADAWRAAPPRPNGQTLHTFLASSPVYASPRKKEPTLQSFVPLDADSPRLMSLLGGLDGQKILRDSLRAAATNAVDSIGAELARAEQLRKQLDGMLVTSKDLMTTEARNVVSAQFPIGLFFEIAVQVVRSRRSRIMQYASVPVDWIYLRLKTVMQWIKSFRESKEVQLFNELETERIEDGCESLIKKWRVEFPEYSGADGMFSAQRTQKVAEAFKALPLPAMGKSWQKYVKAAAADWYDTNRWKANALASLYDVGVFGGIVLLGVDLFVGGSIGTITFGAIAAGTGGTLATLMQIIHWFSLNSVLEEAQNRYLTERASAIEEHFIEHLAGPLFYRTWQQKGEALQGAPMQACQEACRTLRRLCGQRGLEHV